MTRRSSVKHAFSKILVALLIATFVASALPPQVAMPIAQKLSSSKDLPVGPAAVAAAESLPVEALQAPAPAPGLGVLRFAKVVDADDNATSNPTAAKPVPVIRIGAAGQPLQTAAQSTPADQAVLYAVVALAVEVAPDTTTHNPAGVMVEFHLWNDEGQIDLTQRARADAWGAASAQFFLDDLHLAGQFHYQASAVSYGETQTRSFTFDSDSFSSDVQLGAAHMTTRVEADGRLVVDVRSDPVIDDMLLGVQLTAVRLIPTPSGNPEKELLPPLLARRLDDHHARAEIYLEAGDYLLSAAATSGSIEARSQPAYVHIDQVVAPPIAIVEQLGESSEDGETVFVQYRTPDGDVALLHRAVTDLPPDPEPSSPPIFQEHTRVGPFQWRTQVYSTTVETVFDDGKKEVTLDGFSYDPIARSYDIKIESRMAEPVDDKLTVQVFGPNDVVIYEETVPIWLDPKQPFYYQFSLPATAASPTVYASSSTIRSTSNGVSRRSLTPSQRSLARSTLPSPITVTGLTSPRVLASA